MDEPENHCEYNREQNNSNTQLETKPWLFSGTNRQAADSALNKTMTNAATLVLGYLKPIRLLEKFQLLSFKTENRCNCKWQSSRGLVNFSLKDLESRDIPITQRKTFHL